MALLRTAHRRLRAGPGRRDGVRAPRWLAQLGRHPALLRPRHHQRLRPPHRAQPRVAHRPSLGRGHRDPRDLDLGLRRADRRHGVGRPAHQRHDAGGHRGPRHRGLAGGARHGRAGGRVRPGAVPPHGPGRGGREGLLRRALPRHRRHRRHHRQPDHRALPGGRGPGEGPRRRTGRRFDRRGPAGAPRLHHDPAAHGVGHGLLQLGGGGGRCRAGAAPRRRGGGGVPHPVLRHLRRHQPGGIVRVHPVDVTRHRALRQVRRHRRHAARHRRRSGRAGPGGAARPGRLLRVALRLPFRRSSLRGVGPAPSSPASTSGSSVPRVRARRP